MILVTGGLGMIGTHTALADRHDISGVVHLAGTIPDKDPVTRVFGSRRYRS